MSFQPVVTLTSIPRTSDSFVITDATPTDGVSGYGSTNAPANAAAITIAWGSVQPYAEEPVNVIGVTGSVSTTLNMQANILDGVNTFHIYYGLLQNLVFNIASDRMSITSSDSGLAAIMDGVIALQLDTSFPSMVKSVVGTTINLYEPLPGVLTSGTAIYKYWHGQVQALVMNRGEGSIVNAIARVPVVTNPCKNSQSIVDDIILKLGANIAFDAGNIAKAHEAARLLANNKPYIQTNCATCE